ncbi:macrolide 2'-phosphotransferase [Mycolicibacterium thermoresistibile]
MSGPEDVRANIAAAAVHGLRLDPTTVQVNEAGLDFRVALARAADGRMWVVRIPRRPDAAERAHTEAAVLRFLAPRLSVPIPDWQIHTPELIAYPALPGVPGLTFDEATGQPIWRIDPGSPDYADALGRLIAELHAIPVDEATRTGLPVCGPDEVRERWRRDLDTVAAQFVVPAPARRRWSDWLADDGYWPQWSVLTHGELYPAHVLVDAEDHITGVLDWTTAEVGDPARDLSMQYALAPAAFDRTVAAYRAAGGRVWPRLAEHCAHLSSTFPISYALFALQTGEEQHRTAAQAQLDGCR